MPEELRLLPVPYEHPDVAALEQAAQQFYVQIYGSPDETPFTTADFTPPHGAFLVGYLISSNAGYLFLVVAMGYYANYELFHLAYHMPGNSWVGRLPFMKSLRQQHTLHHDLRLMSSFCFNITYPIGDLIFRTMGPKRKGSAT